MNASDLRVNNYYVIDGEARQLTEDGLLFALQNKQFYDGFQPIVLSPALLERCGFGEKRDTNVEGLIEYSYLRSINIAQSYDILLCTNDGEYILYRELQIIGRRRLKYLHQLQNFFFALTGTELNITL